MEDLLPIYIQFDPPMKVKESIKTIISRYKKSSIIALANPSGLLPWGKAASD